MRNKRDKIISIRVDSDLLEQVNAIIEANTYAVRSRCGTLLAYLNELRGKYYDNDKYRRKFSVADLLEIAMTEFIEDNSAHKK